MEYLFRTLKADEIDCRISQIDKNWCTLLLYKDARVDQNILDETVGAMNWQKRYARENANCIVGIWDNEKNDWVEKEDTGTESFSEAEKGLASDSFKRACFNWGIGRELYTAPSIFIFPKKEIKYKNNGKEVEEFFEYKENKYTTKTRFYVDYIDYDDNRKIKDLLIRDDKNNIRFEELSKETEKIRNKKLLLLKDLIEKNEDKDDKFNRNDLYKYYNATTDTQLKWNDLDKAIELLKKKLESE